MSPYAHPEYAAFVAAMRGDATDRVTPLVCADWLEERGKEPHARFVRGCVRMAELRDILDECLKQDLHYTDPTRSVPDRELTALVSRLRPLINRHCHEWTGGMFRRLNNPTAYDWPLGFLRSCRWAVESDHAAPRRLAGLLTRQPVGVVNVALPPADEPFAARMLDYLSLKFRGVVFRCMTQQCGEVVRQVAPEVVA